MEFVHHPTARCSILFEFLYSTRAQKTSEHKETLRLSLYPGWPGRFLAEIALAPQRGLLSRIEVCQVVTSSQGEICCLSWCNACGTRPLQESGDDNEDPGKYLCLWNASLSRYVGRCADVYKRQLLDGDAMLMTRDSINLNLIHPAPVNFLGFRVPRDAIAPLAGSIDDALVRMVPAGSDAIKLLVTYARAIAEQQQSLDTPELQRLVATHIHDLIAVAVGATRDGHEIAKERGIRAARLRAIISDITANLRDCDLTVAAVAQRQRVTPRYLHKLFEGEERCV